MAGDTIKTVLRSMQTAAYKIHDTKFLSELKLNGPCMNL